MNQRAFQLAILEYFNSSKSFHENKKNVLGFAGQRGNLERFLSLEFDSEIRARAYSAFKALETVGHIRPTFHDVRNPEDWYQISESGMEALRRKALDDLDMALQLTNPALVDLRNGAWEALQSNRPDSLRQAAHSGRELIRQVLASVVDEDGPPEEGNGGSDSSSSKMTRKMKAKLVYKRTHGDVSKSELALIDSHCEIVDNLYARLSAEAHRDVSQRHQDVEDLLRSAEIVLRRLLVV